MVLPGGGFRYVAIDKEGHEVARWLNVLNAQGINAAVLTYRTADPEAKRSWSVFTQVLVLGDVERALRTLRYHADTWKIDPDRIILPRCSAGGTMAIQHTLDADGGRPGAADPIDRLSSMPNGVALIYSSLPDQRQPRILHVFQGADHGFGVAPASGTARPWPTLFVEWLRSNTR